MRRFTVFALLLLEAAATAVRGAELSGEEILRLALEGEQQQDKLRQQYTWHDHQEIGPAQANGSRTKVSQTREFDLIFVNGSFHRKLVALNGKPLSAKQQREEEQKIEMTARQIKASGLDKGIRHTGVPLAAILPMMVHTLLREDTVEGHLCWVVQSVPKKDADPKTPEERQALSYNYLHWINEDEKKVMRKEWVVMGGGVETKPGSRTTVAFAENADAVWLPRTAEFFVVRAAAFGPSHVLQTDTYSDYKKFSSSTSVQFEPR